jgi:hypothetical protein
MKVGAVCGLDLCKTSQPLNRVRYSAYHHESSLINERAFMNMYPCLPFAFTLSTFRA